MTDREKRLLISLYEFYVGIDEKELIEGDKVSYEKKGEKHSGKTGVYQGTREDGKYKIKFDDSQIIFIASPSNVQKIGSNPHKVKKLIKILDQMALNGDISISAKEKFVKELNFKDKKHEIDPYDEEDWGEDEIIKPIIPVRRPIVPRYVAPRGSC